MKVNSLTIQINKPIHEVFIFTITPPNTTRWIDSIVSEKTNEWPIRIGTVYTLKNKNNQTFQVIVTTIKENELVEWVSEDGNYHCRYTFKSMGENTTGFEYYEWVDKGEIEEPFTQKTLGKLKEVLELQK